jgi:hypothetical protein
MRTKYDKIRGQNIRTKYKDLRIQILSNQFCKKGKGSKGRDIRDINKNSHLTIKVGIVDCGILHNFKSDTIRCPYHYHQQEIQCQYCISAWI